MAATVQVLEKNGAGPTTTDKTGGTIRFKNADNSAVDLNDPLVKPTSGQKDWSFEKWLILNITGGTFSQISNIRAYTDGTSGLGTGINIWAKSEASYTTPVQLTASTGYSNLFGYTAGSPLSLGAGPFTGTGEKGLHLVLGAEVLDTVSGGLTSTETLTLEWDEI